MEITKEFLESILDTLPADVTFVAADDTFQYFNRDGKRLVFQVEKKELGRDVRECHPPKILEKVERILNGFKDGALDTEELIHPDEKGRLIRDRYFPVRDKDGKYLGCLEITEDITELKEKMKK